MPLRLMTPCAKMYLSSLDLCRTMLFLLLFAAVSDCFDPVSVSQISPKSQNLQEEAEVQLESVLSSKIPHRDSVHEDEPYTQKPSIEISDHIRIERSASPILNDTPPPSISSLEIDRIKDVESNDVDPAARYFNYIKPTSTLSDLIENAEISTSQRMGKDLEDNSFLLKGGPRPLSSGSPIKPTSATQMTTSATITNFNNPRQNPNPDIQDIITGIVKLLNGNVNVHANTQAQRRPVASRINNRGPPRISEAQPLPLDYDHQKPPLRPPPYPFERPDGPVRPFITGVPIPEQIVPSMQQNYRPGFISQNRPPWHRPRPRPPITGNRRPVPPYKPIPSLQEYHQDEDIQLTTAESELNEAQDVVPTDTTYENEFVEEEEEEEVEPPSNHQPAHITEQPIKKDDHTKKKDTKIKTTEKKPIIPLTQAVKSTDVTTIIQSTSEINTAQVISSSFEETSQLLDATDIVESSMYDGQSSTTSSLQATPDLQTVPIKSEDSSTSIVKTTEILAKTDSVSSTTSTTSIFPNVSNDLASTSTPSYHPRPGIVLDDPEFKPGGLARPSTRPQRPQVQPTRHHPPGYGEIFDVTLSAIQGPGSVSGSQQTINIKPFGSYGGSGSGDIIISSSGDEGFVSIDGKRTYINLFGESTDEPIQSSSTQTAQSSHSAPPAVIGTGYAIPETEDVGPTRPTKVHKPHIQPTQIPAQQRPHYRPRTTQPPVRIDTCIVGDDSTCDQAQNERCRTENGVSSCHCRPGYSRRKHREPCRRVVSFFMSLRVDRIYERRIVWDKLLLDRSSEPFGQLSFESVRAIDSAMSMTPFSDEFMEAKVNNIYRGDSSHGSSGVFVNLTLKLEENGETLRPNLRSDVQKHLLGVIHRRNNNIGNSVLYVESPPGSISNLQDLDECQSRDLNDCHSNAICTNTWGSFRCECERGFRDPWSDQPLRAGRECLSCPESHCNSRGMCSYDDDGVQICTCEGSYYGSQCEIDGEVLGVAIGASVAAVIIIVLTLICLIMWSRRWHREQKNAIGSPVFGYMTAGPVKGGMGQSPYQVTLEDRMRWAQIADVMAQANHYAAEPVAPASTRPSSAMFGYPNLQALNMGTLGGISMAGTLPLHNPGVMPPVPLPRLGLNPRSSGMRTLENSSSSEEEDRTDLLGRNFQVPRPKSRSNGSIANQSGIYYDVDYEPSGGDLYGGTTTTSISNPIPGPQGIPMSTYTSGRAPSTYYMK